MRPHAHETSEPVISFHLLGTLAFDDCAALERRLAYEAGEGTEGRVVVLLCEHPEIITVGCEGSWGHIRLGRDELQRRQLEVRWESRSGGCVVHSPGQLAVYPIVPLARLGWSAASYSRRIEQACRASFEGLSVSAVAHPAACGLWGKSGQLAAMGVSDRNGVSRGGVFINVCPTSTAVAHVDCTAADSLPVGQKRAAGSLLAERRQPVRMSAVRSAMVTNLAAAFGCEHYHLHTGHPHLRESLARVS